MNGKVALRILALLADGRDPETGAALPRDSVFQQPDVIRALAVAVQTVRGSTIWQDSIAPARAGATWTEDEEKWLRLAFEAGRPLRVIAHNHQRTVCAIASRLESLGCTNEEVRELSLHTPPPAPAGNYGRVRHGAPNAAQPAIERPAARTGGPPGRRRRSSISACVPGDSARLGADSSDQGES